MRIILYAVVPVLGLLIAIGVWALVLRACAAAPWLGWFTPANCPAPPTAASEAARAELARGEALRAELRRLQHELAARAACDSAPFVGPGDPLDSALLERRDIGVLEGCWLFDSDLARAEPETGAVSLAETWNVCFDAAGMGEQTIAFGAGTVCQGTLRAGFRGDGAISLADESAVSCEPGPELPTKDGACFIDAYGRATCVLHDGDSAVSVSIRRAE
jgi:hypothetical protein